MLETMLRICPSAILVSFAVFISQFMTCSFKLQRIVIILAP